jgi:hypothetical protein
MRSAAGHLHGGRKDATKFRTQHLRLLQEATSPWFLDQHRGAHQQHQQVRPDGITGCRPITVLVTHGNGRVDSSPGLAQHDRYMSADSPRLPLDLAVADDLVNHDNRDAYYEDARHSVGGQRVI